MMDLLRKVALPVLALMALLSAIGCGPSGGDWDSVVLGFSPRDLPVGSTTLSWTVVARTGSNQGLACVQLVGPDANKNFADVDTSSALTGSVLVPEPVDTTAIPVVIEGLAPGLALFFLEAKDLSATVLACGCGEGEIVAGAKTTIPVLMTQECGP